MPSASTSPFTVAFTDSPALRSSTSLVMLAASLTALAVFTGSRTTSAPVCGALEPAGRASGHFLGLIGRVFRDVLGLAGHVSGDVLGLGLHVPGDVLGLVGHVSGGILGALEDVLGLVFRHGGDLLARLL